VGAVAVVEVEDLTVTMMKELIIQPSHHKYKQFSRPRKNPRRFTLLWTLVPILHIRDFNMIGLM
jgi:hypothetical protein